MEEQDTVTDGESRDALPFEIITKPFTPRSSPLSRCNGLPFEIIMMPLAPRTPSHPSRNALPSEIVN